MSAPRPTDGSASKPRRAKRFVASGLFAGIGGFELGLAASGIKVAMLCENAPAARAVLRERFPRIDLAEDVRDVKQLPAGVNLLCAGFPCQDLSSVGEKEGIDGSRSSLVKEVFRILRRNSVEWVIIENVPFMLQLNRGEAMNAITTALEELGYAWAYRVIDSMAFGLPQRRRRVYLVASLTEDPRGVLLADDAPPARSPVPTLDRPIGFYWTEGMYAVGLALDAVPPLKNGSTIGIPSPPAILMPDGEVVLPDVRDGERLQGFESDWTAPAEAVAKRSIRWTLVGNAVTVDVVKWLGRRLKAPSQYGGASDVGLCPGARLPNAGWSLGGARFGASVSSYPVCVGHVGLKSFLRFAPKTLSAKATNGFLRRANSGGLRFPLGFLEALERHAQRLGERENVTA